MPVEAARPFFDTNVLLYLISDDIAKSRKLDVHLIGGGLISVQVLNEFLNVSRKKYGLEASQIRPFLAVLRDTLSVVPVTARTHDIGLDIIERYKLSTYDAMIVAAALDNECDVVFSEDMQDGMLFFGQVRIIDPFAHA